MFEQVAASDLSGSAAGVPRALQRWSSTDRCLVEGHSVEMLQALIEARATERLQHSAHLLATRGTRRSGSGSA